jgi:uncharacterized protein
MSPFSDAAAQAGSLREVGHRPWPLNQHPWVMGQTWRQLLFAHWPVAYDALCKHVPSSLEIEQWDGSAWLGMTPFRVVGLRVRGLPSVPQLSNFLELNCRTYVRRGNRPGIWFFSLDASSRLAVKAAQSAYALPYRHAQIKFDGETFTARRSGQDASFSASYRGLGDARPARPGSLEHFLTERYCLYAGNGELRADIHHPPWQLQRAEAALEELGISPVAVKGEPLYHYAERQDVVIWRPDAT